VLPAALTRGPFWLASFALHGAVFLAAGHLPAGTATTAPPASDDTLAVDLAPVAPDPPILPDLPLRAPTQAPAQAGVPPTHTHPYPVPLDHDAHPHDPSIVHVMPLAAPPPAPAPITVAATPDIPAVDGPEPARFRMVVDSRDMRPATPPPGARGTDDGLAPAAVPASGPGSDADPLPEARATSPAVLTRHAVPAYPEEARAAQIEADVMVELIIGRSGDVLSARVVERAGYGLDEAALRAVRSWRYEPARLDGRPVAVRRRAPISFRLR